MLADLEIMLMRASINLAEIIFGLCDTMEGWRSSSD
jgi:hypothetical protein